MKLGYHLGSLPAWFLTGAIASAGCVGHVDKGNQPPSGGTGTATPSGPTGVGATPGNGTSPGNGTGTGVVPVGGTGNGAGSTMGMGTGTGTNTGTGTGVVIPAGPRDSGRVSIRPLNRIEYNNTVRDLLGTAQQPATAFVSDTPAFAFDNNAEQGFVLVLTGISAGLYEQAAEALAAEAITAAFKAKLVTCDVGAAGSAGSTCQQTFVTTFGAKAYRRPLSTTEVANYVALMAAAKTAGATGDEMLRTAIEAFLQSANFLFRIELDPDPTSTVAHPVAPYEMASRLSYLVYRSMPDQALFDAAAGGKLGMPADVQAQLTRLLADPKGSTFAQDFSAQWLGVRSLESIQFDPTFFPKFTPALAASMKSEITSFFSDFVKENLPADQLMTAKFSYIDNNLATHYGLPAVGSTTVKKTDLASPQRGGLLTMAGTLAATSYMTRTSLVKRGAWVQSQLLCTDPPPPPNNVPPFPTGKVMGTQRQVLEMHRSDPSCAVCHVILDNIGIALENYDGTGAWRTADSNGAVIGDVNGTLTNAAGTFTFNGGQELAAVVAKDPRFVPCVSKKMLGYALGRTLGATDDPYVSDIAASTASAQPGVSDILSRVVASDTFNMRHGEP